MSDKSVFKIPEKREVKLKTPEELNKILKSLLINPNDKLPPPLKAWATIDENGDESVMGTLENFSLIIGKAKSRKSFFIGIAVSASISNKLLLGKFKGCLPDDKNEVLYFDTEQGKYHVQLSLKRICELTGIDVPTNLKVYGLRSKSTEERLELIEHCLKENPKVGLVIIDGVRDIVTSINDEAEATKIGNLFLNWTEVHKMHLIAVLHQNKNDSNARGHLGSELVNKAETVLSVNKDSKDKNISIVNAEQCRNKEPEPFAFEIIGGLPQLVANYEMRVKPANKLEPYDINDYDKYRILEGLFRKQNTYSYGDLVAIFKDEFNKKYKGAGKGIGMNKIKEIISVCKNKGWLLQEKPKAPYTLGKFNGLEENEDDCPF
ncbi:AAA family ATPase [Aureibaculum sp. A20]|uniref:AAA family ATPase n=1 Tax=Aureibaculum flavum TaxID=2795986 RepID=A0ABS0WQC9_9FLAO|nr:AAA family ATPase [Aureibaculum flavum]MBJ2174181.1 AAA family ATPase [Aureibaculum flavum]